MPSKCAPATGLQSVLLTGLGYQRFDRVAGLRTLGEPVVNAFQIEIDFMGVADGIVRSEHFDATAIAHIAAIGGYEFIEGTVRRTVSLKSKTYCHDSSNFLYFGCILRCADRDIREPKNWLRINARIFMASLSLCQSFNIHRHTRTKRTRKLSIYRIALGTRDAHSVIHVVAPAWAQRGGVCAQ